MVLGGPTDGSAFEAGVTQVLVPTLRPGDIVVMDNLPAHKRARGAHRNAPSVFVRQTHTASAGTKQLMMLLPR